MLREENLKKLYLAFAILFSIATIFRFAVVRLLLSIAIWVFFEKYINQNGNPLENNSKLITYLLDISIAFSLALAVYLLAHGIVGYYSTEKILGKIIAFFDELVKNSEHFYALDLPEELIEDYNEYYNDIVSGYEDVVDYLYVYLYYASDIWSLFLTFVGAIKLVLGGLLLPFTFLFYDSLKKADEKLKKRINYLFAVLIVFAFLMLITFDLFMVASIVLILVWLAKIKKFVDIPKD